MSDLRRIDALIAEHVHFWSDFRIERDEVPHYSTDIALAIGVLEKLAPYMTVNRWGIESDNRGYCISLLFYDQSYPLKRKMTWNCSLPEAICRHVLHVLGVSYE